MKICINCGNSNKEDSIYCNNCGGILAIIPSFFLNRTPIENISKKIIEKKYKTPKEIMETKIKQEYITGFEFFAKIPLHFRVLIYGKYGGGKSTFALQFANAISESDWRGKTIYICAEEGNNSATLKKKIEQFSINSENIVFVNTMQDAQDIIKTGEYSNIFVDSISRTKITVSSAAELYDSIRGGLVLISHITKAEKSYKGDSGFGHDVDIVCDVSKGILRFEKNRYGEAETQFIQYDIFNKNKKIEIN